MLPYNDSIGTASTDTTIKETDSDIDQNNMDVILSEV